MIVKELSTPPALLPEISVIVPIYNGEKYLTMMVDSILQQTYKDFELLLIDDGSTDKSHQMIEKYANKDRRVKAFHKENGGLSDARNYGLDRACGKYVVFADCDDYMYPDNIEVMHNEIQGYELLVCNYAQGMRNNLDNIERNNIIKYRACANNIEELKENILDIDVWYMAMCWNKMYLRSVIENNHLRFKHIKSEDEIWSYEFLNCVNSVKRIEWMGLCYFHNPGSLGNGHKAIPEMDWLLKQEKSYCKMIERLDITDKEYLNRITFRTTLRLSSFLLKGYYKDTHVNRKERLKRWKQARQLKHRFCNIKEIGGLSRFRIAIIWILKHRLEKLADIFLYLITDIHGIKVFLKNKY